MGLLTVNYNAQSDTGFICHMFGVVKRVHFWVNKAADIKSKDSITTLKEVYSSKGVNMTDDGTLSKGSGRDCVSRLAVKSLAVNIADAINFPEVSPSPSRRSSHKLFVGSDEGLWQTRFKCAPQRPCCVIRGADHRLIEFVVEGLKLKDCLFMFMSGRESVWIDGMF